MGEATAAGFVGVSGQKMVVGGGGWAVTKRAGFVGCVDGREVDDGSKLKGRVKLESSKAHGGIQVGSLRQLHCCQLP